MDLQNVTITINEMQDRLPYAQWLDYINLLMPTDLQVDGSEEVIVGYPNYMIQLEHLLSNTSQRTITNFMVWKVILDYSAEYLNVETTQKFDRLVADVLGQKRAIDRWEFCLELTKRR